MDEELSQCYASGALVRELSLGGGGRGFADGEGDEAGEDADEHDYGEDLGEVGQR